MGRDPAFVGEAFCGAVARAGRSQERGTRHRYTVDVWPRYGANCKRWDGTDDRSRNSVRHWYFVELQPGDQPLAMVLAVAAYWEGLGFEVSYEADDFGAGGSIYTADGHRFGFLAFNHLADEDDSLLLDSTTACYRRP